MITNREIRTLLVVAVLLVGVVGITAQSGPIPQEPCMDAESRERIRTLVTQAIDNALIDRVQHVFDIWMKDSSDQPKRAITGMHEAISAYIRSRADALKWSPPLCPNKEKAGER